MRRFLALLLAGWLFASGALAGVVPTIGTAAGNKTIQAITVGTAAENKAVVVGTIGTAAGNKTFFVALSASASPTSMSGAHLGAGTVTSTSTTATPTGGVGPFTYAWSYAVSSGSPPTIVNPTSATTTVRATMPAGSEWTGTIACTVTDTATGATASTGAVSYDLVTD